MKILVTGASGLVGNALKRISADYKHDFVFLDGRKDLDLTDEKATRDKFAEIQPDIVVHLAARVGGLYRNMNEGYDQMMENLKINMNVTHSCKEAHLKKFITVMSTCVFPHDCCVKFNEDDLMEGWPHSSNKYYAMAKRMEYMMGQALEQYGYVDKHVALSPCNLYGPHDNFDLEESHVIPALVAKAAAGKLAVLGSGEALRQFMYVDDFAKIIMHFVENEAKFDHYICAPPQMTSVKEVAQILGKLNGTEPAFSKAYEGQNVRFAETNRLMAELGDFNFTTVKDGLISTTEWYKKFVAKK